METLPLADEWSARQQFRRLSRQLLSQADGAELHIQHIDAASRLHGTEPLQGALADFFHAIPVTDALFSNPVIQHALPLLPAHVAASFAQLVGQPPLARQHALATRWGVLTTVSAELPARARRASSDNAKRLAQELVRALLDKTDGAAQIEADFLAHCSACHDKLAFMLARRELLRNGVFTELPGHWQALADKLENLHEPGLQT